MSGPFLNLQPNEIRAPEIEVLPDNRKRLTRFFRIAQLNILPAELNFAWGTVDKGTAPDGWEGLRLTNRRFSDEARISGLADRNDKLPIVQLIYEQIDESDETAVGGTDYEKLEDGRTARVKNFIQFTTGSYTPGTVGNQDGTSGYYLLKEEAPDDGTVRRIKRYYVTSGIIAQDDQSLQGAKLLKRTITSVKTVPSTPSGYTLVGSPVQSPNGLPVYTYTFYKGDGLVEERIDPGAPSPGLRVVTHIALGTKDTPSGDVIRDDYREADGYKIYTVASVQTASGGSSPTGATFSTERYLDFLYPGRAKAFSETLNSRKMLDVFKSAPVSAKVKATITLSYQTGNTVGSISDLWNPTEWATVRAQWIGFGSNPHNVVDSLPGYRTVDDTPVEETCSAIAPIDVSIFGNPVYGNTTARITVTGGPDDPGGNTYTLDAYVDREPVYTKTNGSPVYRKTVITATIPAQSSLPV